MLLLLMKCVCVQSGIKSWSSVQRVLSAEQSFLRRISSFWYLKHEYTEFGEKCGEGLLIKDLLQSSCFQAFLSY